MNGLSATATDADVIARSVRSPELFAIVFDRYHAVIHAYVARRVGREAADDALSEVFLAAFSNRGRFDMTAESARPWLYGIAGNVLRRGWRTSSAASRLAQRAVSQAELAAASSLGDALRQEDAADEWVVISELLRKLTDGDREALLLFAWEELTYPQIAEAMGIPIGTVRSRIHRARALLRESLHLESEVENRS